MSLAERLELARPPRHKELSEQLRVAFHRFAGAQTGQEDLIAFPDFTLKEGGINPEWLDWFRNFNKRIGTPNPGTLEYNPATKQFKPVDPDTAVGQIFKLKEQANTALEDHPSGESRKAYEQKVRSELVDIFNGYGGIRFNLVRDVVNGLDFRGVNLEYIASRDPRGWYQDLLRTRQQSVNYILFDRWEEADKGVQTPTRADWFFQTLFEELSKTLQDQLSSRARIFKELLLLEGSIAYREIADIFYGGDMIKTYINLSAVARMSGLKVPAGWQAFQGSTSEFKSLQQRLSEFTEGLGGYLQAADDLYGGDMLKTYINLSAVARMSGLQVPAGWQQFHGSTSEFNTQRECFLQNPSISIDEFMAKVNIGSRDKARPNLAAIKKMASAT